MNSKQCEINAYIQLIEDQFEVACGALSHAERVEIFKILPSVESAVTKMFNASGASTIVEYISLCANAANYGQSLFLNDILAMKTKDEYQRFTRELVYKALSVGLTEAEKIAMEKYESAIAQTVSNILVAHIQSLK